MNNFDKKLKVFREGKTKASLEDKLLDMCTCDGKEIIDSNEHDKSCPCKKYLKKLGF